jgi:hypothetical protein
LPIPNLAFQNEEKQAAELVVANTELAFQNEEKRKSAAELVVANTNLFSRYRKKKNGSRISCC